MHLGSVRTSTRCAVIKGLMPMVSETRAAQPDDCDDWHKMVDHDLDEDADHEHGTEDADHADHEPKGVHKHMVVALVKDDDDVAVHWK